MIRTLIADDQALVRGALAAILELESDIEVAAEVGEGTDIVYEAQDSRPDVALIDVQIPGLDGLSATGELTEVLPSCRVLMCTTFLRSGYVARAMDAGALGLVAKDASPERIVSAVRRVHSGLRVVDPAFEEEPVVGGVSPLTSRERDVLRAVGGGAAVSDIAQSLYLSADEVRGHLSAAMGKLDVRTRAEAARRAEERGWL